MPKAYGGNESAFAGAGEFASADYLGRKRCIAVVEWVKRLHKAIANAELHIPFM